MKMEKILIAAVSLILLSVQGVSAQTQLSAWLEDDNLQIRWSAEGNCVLTVYGNDMPVTVCNVDGESGGTEIAAQNGVRYAVKLETPVGCETVQSVEILKEEQAALDPAMQINSPAMQKSSSMPDAYNSVGQLMQGLANQVVSEVNAERAKYGLSALRIDAELSRAARVRAEEIVKRFSHTRPDGTKWSTVSASALGENIARGHNTADRVMAAWMTSDGHRRNILRESYGSIGVCALQVNGVIHWVQLFGR